MSTMEPPYAHLCVVQFIVLYALSGLRKPNQDRRVRAVLAAAGPNASQEERLRLQDLINVCRSNPGLLFSPAQVKAHSTDNNLLLLL